jgi:hypothetical protein
MTYPTSGAAGKIIGGGKLKDGDRVGGDVVSVNLVSGTGDLDGFTLSVPQTDNVEQYLAPTGAIPRKTNQTILDESDCPVQFWGYHPAVAVETTQDIAIGDLLYRSDGDDYLVTEATQPSLASLTDSSGGTAATTLPAIGATYDQDEVRHSVASLNAKIDDVLQVLRSVGIALEARTDNDEGNIAVFLKGL